MSDEYGVTPMHIAITVSDVDRSAAFYTGALGFRHPYERTADEPFSSAFQPGEVKFFREVYLILGGTLIVLCAFDNPKSVAAPEAPYNQIGIRRITFGVPNIAAAEKRVVAHGGKILEHSRYEHPQVTAVVVTDPDGNELELVQRSG